MSRIRSRTACAGIVAAALTLSACAWLSPAEPITEPIDLIAVMPIEREQPRGTEVGADTPRLAPGAERVVTSEIYAVLSEMPRIRFVPDLAVAQALSRTRPEGTAAERAQALGRAVGADAVLFGTVWRYVEREGSDYGSRSPAAVGFRLHLLGTASGQLLWDGGFDEGQQSLSANLWNWWQFWRGGPKWFSAREFTHLGLERVLEDLRSRLS